MYIEFHNQLIPWYQLVDNLSITLQISMTQSPTGIEIELYQQQVTWWLSY